MAIRGNKAAFVLLYQHGRRKLGRKTNLNKNKHKDAAKTVGSSGKNVRWGDGSSISEDIIDTILRRIS